MPDRSWVVSIFRIIPIHYWGFQALIFLIILMGNKLWWRIRWIVGCKWFSKSLTCSRPYYSEFCPLKSWITLIVLDIEVYWIKRFFGEVKRKKKFVLRLSVPKELRNLTPNICSLESRKSWTTINLSGGLQIIIYVLFGHLQQSAMKPRKLKINEKKNTGGRYGFLYLLCLIQNDETRS